MKCLEETVCKRGPEKWLATLAKAGIPKATFAATDDVDDKVVVDLLQAAAAVLKISVNAAMAAFDEQWTGKYGRLSAA